MVEALLRAGASPDAVFQTGETPIMRAARVGDVGTVKALLARNVNVNAKEPHEEQTALMWAVVENHLDVAKLLIEAGADVRARSRIMDQPRPGRRIGGAVRWIQRQYCLLPGMGIWRRSSSCRRRARA